MFSFTLTSIVFRVKHFNIFRISAKRIYFLEQWFSKTCSRTIHHKISLICNVSSSSPCFMSSFLCLALNKQSVLNVDTMDQISCRFNDVKPLQRVAWYQQTSETSVSCSPEFTIHLHL